MSVDLEPDPGAVAACDEPEVRVARKVEDRKGHEFLNGQWVEKPMSMRAGVVGASILTALSVHVRPRRLGLVFNPDGAYRLPGSPSGRIRKPDVSFVATDHLPADRDEDGSWPIAPDLAVEVISPNEEAQDAEQKLDEYLRAGVRLVWVAYLPTRNIWAYRPDGTARRYRAEDTLTGEDVLPGFAVPVAELFEGV